MKKIYPNIEGIPVKKQFGQHFLRNQAVIEAMLGAVALTPQTSVFEIGCGDGFLTRSILQTSIERLWVFEIDHDWVTYVNQQYPDARMTIFEENILDVDFARFEAHKPWTLLANLPYQITFPILRLLKEHRAVLREGVIMVQEEVAQKIVKNSGRGYGFPSLYFQHFFEWQLLAKVIPGDFYPPPAVFSRLLYFKPRLDAPHIPEEEAFWAFIKFCFSSPRRTLKNNLNSTHYAGFLKKHDLGNMRAQEMSMDDFLALWDRIRADMAN